MSRSIVVPWANGIRRSTPPRQPGALRQPGAVLTRRWGNGALRGPQEFGIRRSERPGEAAKKKSEEKKRSPCEGPKAAFASMWRVGLLCVVTMASAVTPTTPAGCECSNRDALSSGLHSVRELSSNPAALATLQMAIARVMKSDLGAPENPTSAVDLKRLLNPAGPSGVRRLGDGAPTKCPRDALSNACRKDAFIRGFHMGSGGENAVARSRENSKGCENFKPPAGGHNCQARTRWCAPNDFKRFFTFYGNDQSGTYGGFTLRDICACDSKTDERFKEVCTKPPCKLLKEGACFPDLIKGTKAMVEQKLPKAGIHGTDWFWNGKQSNMLQMTCQGKCWNPNSLQVHRGRLSDT